MAKECPINEDNCWICFTEEEAVGIVRHLEALDEPLFEVKEREAGTADRAAIKDQNLKRDLGKPRMELLPRAGLEEIAKVLAFGAQKYEADGWRKGMEWRRIYGAALRHLIASLDGEDTDPESGLDHLGHLGCCVLFLIEYKKRGLGKDDRWKP